MAGRQRMRGSQLVAKQRVAYANSGVEISTGTPAQTAAATEGVNEFDAQMLYANAVRESLGFKEVGRKYRHQKTQLNQQLESAKSEAQMQLIGQGLGLIGGLL